MRSCAGCSATVFLAPSCVQSGAGSGPTAGERSSPRAAPASTLRSAQGPHLPHSCLTRRSLHCRGLRPALLSDTVGARPGAGAPGIPAGGIGVASQLPGPGLRPRRPAGRSLKPDGLEGSSEPRSQAPGVEQSSEDSPSPRAPRGLGAVTRTQGSACHTPCTEAGGLCSRPAPSCPQVSPPQPQDSQTTGLRSNSGQAKPPLTHTPRKRSTTWKTCSFPRTYPEVRARRYKKGPPTPRDDLTGGPARRPHLWGAEGAPAAAAQPKLGGRHVTREVLGSRSAHAGRHQKSCHRTGTPC